MLGTRYHDCALISDVGLAIVPHESIIINKNHLLTSEFA